MLTTYPQFSHRGVAKALLERIEQLARLAGCTISSIEVIDENDRALRLYEQLCCRLSEQRSVLADTAHPYHGNVLLLTKMVP